MSRQIPAAKLAQLADLREAPTAARTDIDRTFGLPTGLYVATVGAYLAFLAVMALGFQSRNMILPMAVFVVYILMAFGVPAMWTRMKPDHRAQAMTWAQFERFGIETATGTTKAKDAMLQVLILPVLILFWGVAVVTIAAVV